jgi:microcompartment protein CcmK/EutM
VFRARVIAKVTGSVQHPAYDGRPLFVVRPERLNETLGKAFVAVDTVGCALGDEVLVARVPGLGRAILGTDRAPVRSMILGILDEQQG